jgi:hypothetical protein
MFLLGSLAQWEEEGWDVMIHEVRSFGPTVLIGMVLSVPVGILAIIAGMRLHQRRSRGLAIAASILATVTFAPTFLVGGPIGILALVVLNRADVRAAFAQVKRSSSSNRQNAAPSHSSVAVFPPGAGPRMLAITLGFVSSIAFVLVGLGLLIYAAAAHLPDAEQWSWYFGGGIGCLIGGIAAMITCWNQYRTLHGKRDFMQDPRWNVWDTFLLVYGIGGASYLALGLIGWNSLEFWPRTAALVVGGIVALQGIGMSLWRWAFRYAFTQQASHSALGLQMFLVAVSILMCSLLVVGGVAMSVYSATSLPGGSVKFWAGIVSAAVWLLGGGGGLLVTWNWYRSLEGGSNWMTDEKTNVLDRAAYAIAGIGAALVIGALAASPWIATINFGALELLGGVILLPAAIAIFIRAMMRRAAQQTAESKSRS